MNNQELFDWFRDIAKDNRFDIELALRDKNNIKKYKTSLFYKQTRYNIHKAYALYSMNSIQSIINFANSKLVHELTTGHYEYLLVVLEDMLNDFDVSALDNVVNYITDKLMSIDTEKLKNSLEQAIKEYQGIIKQIR